MSNTTLDLAFKEKEPMLNLWAYALRSALCIVSGAVGRV
jgi:hypothetical protein